MPDDSLNSLTDGTSIITKRGYSIWSLLVFMTLLAVWLAVPRAAYGSFVSFRAQYTLMICHQLLLWIVIAVMIWRFCGKRNIILALAACIWLIAWGPLASELLGFKLIDDFIRNYQLFDAYSRFYEDVCQGFGYAH